MMYVGSLGRVVLGEETKAEFRQRLKRNYAANREFAKKLPYNKDLSWYDEKGITSKGSSLLGAIGAGIGMGISAGPVGALAGAGAGAIAGYYGNKLGRSLGEKTIKQYEKGLR